MAEMKIRNPWERRKMRTAGENYAVEKMEANLFIKNSMEAGYRDLGLSCAGRNKSDRMEEIDVVIL